MNKMLIPFCYLDEIKHDMSINLDAIISRLSEDVITMIGVGIHKKIGIFLGFC